MKREHWSQWVHWIDADFGPVGSHAAATLLVAIDLVKFRHDQSNVKTWRLETPWKIHRVETTKTNGGLEDGRWISLSKGVIFSGSMLSFLECTPKQIILEASLPKTNIAPENRPCFKPKQSPNHCSLSILLSFWVFREGTYHPLKRLTMTMILQTSFLSCLHVFLVASLICLVCSAIQCLKGVRVSWMMFQWTKHLQLIGSRQITSTVVLWRDDIAIHSTVCRQMIDHLPQTWVKKYKTKNRTSPTRWSKATFLIP